MENRQRESIGELEGYEHYIDWLNRQAQADFTTKKEKQEISIVLDYIKYWYEVRKGVAEDNGYIKDNGEGGYDIVKE